MQSPRPFVVAGIQARTGSSRLPGKVLADLAGKPLVRRVWERAGAARTVDLAVVLTSNDPSDDALADYLAGAAIPFRRGPLDDVLARYLALIEELGADYVVRVTGDCPLISPEYVDRQVEALIRHDADLTRLTRPETVGVLGGQGAMSARALLGAAGSDDPRDREHAGAFWITRQRELLRTVEVGVDSLVDPAHLRPDLRLAVDEASDLALVRAVYEALAPRHDSLAPLATVLAWLDEHPEVRALNAGVVESEANRALRELQRANGRKVPS